MALYKLYECIGVLPVLRFKVLFESIQHNIARQAWIFFLELMRSSHRRYQIRRCEPCYFVRKAYAQLAQVEKIFYTEINEIRKRLESPIDVSFAGVNKSPEVEDFSMNERIR